MRSTVYKTDIHDHSDPRTQRSFEQRSLQVGLLVILCIRELRQVVASVVQGDLLRDTILINITEVLVFEPICAGFSE